MTNKEKLKIAIERDIDNIDNYKEIIKKIERREKMKKNTIWKLSFVPVCILFAAVIGHCNGGIFNPKIDNFNSKKDIWLIKEVKTDKKNESEPNTIPKWDEMSVSQQFSEFKYNNTTYFSRTTNISAEFIIKSIGETSLSGYDTYTETTHNKTGKLYSIKNVSEECALAVKFEEDEQYYIYVNSNYRPKTLGQFIEDLNLKEHTSFSTVYYDYWDNDIKEKIEIEFYDVNDEIIWQKLFTNLNLENIYSDDDTEEYASKVFNIDISTDIPILGYKNASVTLTDNGYLLTNILDTGKGFYIGKDKVQEFLEYIEKNYDGYKIVHIDEEENDKINE